MKNCLKIIMVLYTSSIISYPFWKPIMAALTFVGSIHQGSSLPNPIGRDGETVYNTFSYDRYTQALDNIQRAFKEGKSIDSADIFWLEQSGSVALRCGASFISEVNQKKCAQINSIKQQYSLDGYSLNDILTKHDTVPDWKFQQWLKSNKKKGNIRRSNKDL